MLPQHAQPCSSGRRALGAVLNAAKPTSADAPLLVARTGSSLQLTSSSTSGTAAQLGLSAATTVLSAGSVTRSPLLGSAASELQLGPAGTVSAVPLLSSAHPFCRHVQGSSVPCSTHRFLPFRALRSRCSCATLRRAAQPRTAAWIALAAAERRVCCRRARMRRQAPAMQSAPQSWAHVPLAAASHAAHGKDRCLVQGKEFAVGYCTMRKASATHTPV